MRFMVRYDTDSTIELLERIGQVAFMAGEGVAMAAWVETVTLIALCFVLALAAGAHMVWRAAWRSSRMLPVRDIWFWLDRDVNAARNILAEGLRIVNRV